MNASFILFGILNTLFVLSVSPFFMMLIKKVKAMAQRRRGPPLLQGYYNIWKLMRKEVVYSPTSSYIMRITPYLSIMVMLVAVLFVPLFFIPQPVGAIGNVILFLYLLALGKFFMSLSGLDAGSTFGGMGSSREMSLSAVLEPVVIIIFAALAFVLKTTNMHTMFLNVSGTSLATQSPSLLLLSIPLFIVLIVETARVPFDNPETHLELTMVHEAMILEQSGRNLALMEVSHAMKQTLLMAILINIFFPAGISTTMGAAALLIGMGSFLLKGVVLCMIIGIFESSIGKLRLFRLPSLFMIAFFLSFITILLEVFA